jgi:lysophospholipase L1-like esterase
MHPTRREFLAASALAAIPAIGRSRDRQPRSTGLTVLFQGDSITDCGRDRRDTAPNTTGGLGTGYPLLVAATTLRLSPERGLRFYNRGVSGNRVPDLQERWQHDALDLAPDVLSILIGVNDLWHKILGRTTGTVQDYESGYDALLARTRAALPATRLVVLEPFILRTGAVDESWARAGAFAEFDQRRAAAERVARARGAIWVPLHGMFEQLVRRAPPAYWAADGVHPTPAGHAAIAQLWLESAQI